MTDVLPDNDAIAELRAEEERHTPLARLRERREAIAQQRTTVIPVPGYGGELALVIKPIKWDDAKRIALRVEKSKSHRKELMAQADTVIAATESIVIRDPDTGEVSPLDPGADAITFASPELGAALGFQAGSAREAVFQVFNNDIAVASVSSEISEWSAASGDDADEEFLGES